ncbi:MAG: hypothetical protein MJZ58_00945 [Paludibacteraceae bacterium]|nr:hypothetical protein [Paludibacteraceae bacterium]
MKKMFLAAMAIATIAMVGCKKDKEEPVGPTPGPTPGPTAEVPEIDKPAEGNVTFAIQIPEGSECNGIAIKGTIDNTNWTSTDQYLAADGSIVGPDKCAAFVAIPDFKNWYKTTIKVATEGWEGTDAAGAAVKNYLAGKICLIYTGDNGWQGQATDWKYLDSECTVALSQSSDGNFQVNGTTGIVYVTVGGWQRSECVTIPPRENFTFNISIEGVVPEGKMILTGNFDEKSWGDSDREMTKTCEGKYTWTGSIPGVGFACKVFVLTEAGEQIWAQESDFAVADDATSPIEATFSFATAE